MKIIKGPKFIEEKESWGCKATCARCECEVHLEFSDVFARDIGGCPPDCLYIWKCPLCNCITVVDVFARHSTEQYMSPMLRKYVKWYSHS